MEMYGTANPGMTVRPRPWPRGVASSTPLSSFKEKDLRRPQVMFYVNQIYII